jgi:hypothetical protein
MAEETEKVKIHFNRLRVMYAYTVVVGLNFNLIQPNPTHVYD